MNVSLKVLASLLRCKFDRKVIVLIDEYDHPLTSALGMDTYARISEFLGSVYSQLLKGNKDVQMSYITGTSRVIHQGFFSGLNKMIVDDVFSTMSGERFGFTESEVRELLVYYEASDKFEEVREWYTGIVSVMWMSTIRLVYELHQAWFHPLGLLDRYFQ